ncbi:MAG: flagellar export chaperone FliS [Nitrospirae bacterium]|jgi:flagellar protein FliS|nr:flagellar export chaperone FliS [Nitrospirota bacterium]
MSKGMPILAYQSAVEHTITPAELLIRLYEGAIRAIQILEEGIREKNIPKRSDAVMRATAILGELAVALEGQEQLDWVPRLLALYMFLIEEITVANLKDEPERLQPVRKILEDLLETWKQASGMVPSSASVPSFSPSSAPAGRTVGQRLSMKG